ncbi:ankyrin repeat and protein kinase domain-containing protein [Holotrichia oblita]|uniref:Ankyrin repeat and protein kinase domain-containing protein n=1 Tax=Holotrichia oblita TaxID=644536 RepID=A0ACB9SI83_HOLOL|nr:ankyrin repeat and protein kinase domain-containing protein [Holotrichia oblita]
MKRTRGSESDNGTLYQYAVTAYLAAKLSSSDEVEDYIIYLNESSAGIFDDIVVKVKFKQQHGWYLWLLQVKYRKSADLNKYKCDIDLSQYIKSFYTIMNNPTLTCRQSISSANIVFGIVCNRSIVKLAITTFVGDNAKSTFNPFETNFQLFEHQGYPEYKQFFDKCFLWLEQREENIQKGIQYKCELENVSDVITYIQTYFRDEYLFNQGLTKEVFEIELQKFRFRDASRLSTYLVDQYGNPLYPYEKNKSVPVIGQRIYLENYQYLTRNLSRATITKTFFKSQEKRICLLSGDLEDVEANLSFTNVDSNPDEMHFREKKCYFVKVEGEKSELYWKKLQQFGCIYDINVIGKQNPFDNPLKFIMKEFHKGKWETYYDFLTSLLKKKKLTLILDSFDEIMLACKQQVLKFIRSIVNIGIPIIIATRVKEFALIDQFNAQLIQNGADVNLQNEFGRVPLHLAARWNQVDIIKLLLVEETANINIQDKDGRTALEHAVIEGHMNVVEFLLEKGANKQIQNNTTHETPLHCAARAGCLKIVQTLLDQGADLNARDIDDSTPLFYAAYGGHAHIIQLLLQYGAEVNVQNIYGSTPLHIASGEKANVDAVKMLLDNGAKVNAKDRHNSTPLHFATDYRHKTVVALLLDKGADVNAKTVGNYTPLLFAAKREDIDIVKLLLCRDANTDARSTHGWTALELSIRSKTINLIKVLLDWGSNANIEDRGGCTPLHYAAWKGNTDVVELLLTRDAKVNMTNKYNITPLAVAVHQRHTDLVRLLLDKGADPNFQDGNGETLLDLNKSEHVNVSSN